MNAAARLARPDLADLTALDARERLRRGEISAEDLARACLARIEARDAEVRAWAHLDPEHALAQARALDAWRKSGRPIGPLHGLPVGLKDILDTRDFPTENGTPLDSGRRPARDAALVSRLRAAGAVILGKTATTELAYYHPTATRHPHDPTRTPGGSSSGSAAAVAAGMVPLSVGSQTNGSVVRPASFCGIVGFKPSFGLIARTGALVQAAPLDTIGVFARDVEGAALIAESLQGFDPGDDQSRLQARDPLLETALSRPPVTPAFAFVKSPVWDRAGPETRGALEELAALLGERCDAVDLPDAFGNAHPAHRRLMLAGFARNLRGYYERGREALSAPMREAIEEGRGVSAVDYLAALDWREALNAALDRLFERYDAILTPAAIGEAPPDLSTTGDPVFCTIWSFCGVPALSLPLAEGLSGLPVGVQLVGRRGYDGRLLRTARWLMAHVAEASQRAGHEGGRTP